MVISENNQLNLMLGLPLETSEPNLTVKQFRIKEIAEMGYIEYMSMIATMTQSADDFLKLLIDSPVYMDLYLKKNELRPLFFIILFSEEENTKVFYERSLEILLGLEHGQITIEPFSGQMLFKPDLSSDDVKLIDSDLFDELSFLIKATNGLVDTKEDRDANPYDDKAKEIYDKMKKNREKIARIKAMEDDEEPKTLSDLISGLTARSPSTNKLNVLDYTLYQVYDEYARLYIIDGYETSIKSLMFGADTEISDWGKPN